MALFGFGKKNGEEKPACTCSCGCSCEPSAVPSHLGPITKVRVLGSGCKNCHTLLESTQEAVRTLDLPVQVEYVTDMQEIMASGAMMMPALEINGRIASGGRVLKASQVVKLLEDWGAVSMAKKRIAFLCVHNSCRSQMAEALGRHLAGDRFEFYSAGTETKPRINQDAVRLMKQVYGIDMEKEQYSKTIDKIPAPDLVISMGCDVGCPYIGRAFDDNWQLPDPTGQSDQVFLDVIQQIHSRVEELIQSLS